MVTAVRPAFDVGGFGRLADVQFKKRAEARQDRRIDIDEKSAEQSYRLGELQIKQTESNLQKIKRNADLREGLGKALSNIPEGESQYTTAYNYYMMQGEEKMAYDLRNTQIDSISKLSKVNPESGANMFNRSLGKQEGVVSKYEKTDPIQGDLLTFTDTKTGLKKQGWATKSGDFKEVPEGYTAVDDPSKRTKTLVDLELEDSVTDKFMKEQNLSETDARLKAQAFISENKKGKGISISTDKDGNQVISIGGKSQNGALTRGAKTGVQKDLIEANATHSDMKAIIEKVEDRFLEMPTRISSKFTALKEKWKVGNVSEEDKKELKDYTGFRRESISSLNAYIKQITGAAMSELEAKRLMKAMPNPGMGLFDGDSPTEFRTKLSGVMESLDRVTARNNYVVKHGLASFEDVGLEQIDGIMDRRGDEMAEELKAENPDISAKELNDKIINQLSEEFGIRF